MLPSLGTPATEVTRFPSGPMYRNLSCAYDVESMTPGPPGAVYGGGRRAARRCAVAGTAVTRQSRIKAARRRPCTMQVPEGWGDQKCTAPGKCGRQCVST